MATGGASAEDHLHCSVCLEHFKGRNPRLLSCHHSFCEVCLKNLLKDDQISCPKCREMTAVKDGNVTNLKMNFHILPFLEDDEKSEKKCQLCKELTACLKCKECFKLLCQICANNHGKVKRFKEHTVLKLCLKHDEGISHICKDCVKPVCFSCLIMEHQEHDESVVAYSDGITYIRRNVNNLIDKSKQTIEKMKAIVEEDQVEITKVKLMMTKYKSRQTENELESKELARLVTEIDKNYQQMDKVTVEQNSKLEATEKLANELEQVRHCDEEELLAYAAKYKETGKLIDENIDAMKRFHFVSPEKIHNLKKKRTLLARPRPVAKIRLCDGCEILLAVSGATMWTNSVIIADYEAKKVTQINTEGLVYSIDEEFEYLKSVSIHGTSLYIAQLNYITHIVDVNQPNGKVRKYKPEIQYIRRIHAVSHTKIICTNMVDGMVYQYDPHENSTKLVLEGLKSLTSVSSFVTESGVKYIVTLEDENCLKVYNNKWEYEFTIGLGKGCLSGFLDSPCDSLCVDDVILVVDCNNHRVCQFDLSGKFIRHLLTVDDGLLDPRSFAYKAPYLWIICATSVLCFNIHDL